MKDDLEQRAENLALYLIENRTTVRAAAKKFGISKSTVHMAVVTPNGGSGWSHKHKNKAPGRVLYFYTLV